MHFALVICIRGVVEEKSDGEEEQEALYQKKRSPRAVSYPKQEVVASNKDRLRPPLNDECFKRTADGFSKMVLVINTH